MGMEVCLLKTIMLYKANLSLSSAAYPSMATLFHETQELRLPTAKEWELC